MLWAEVDGVVRVVTDVAVRGIARALANEGQISAVAAAIFCLRRSTGQHLDTSSGVGLPGEGRLTGSRAD